MTAIFIGIILNELGMLHGAILFWYIFYCVGHVLSVIVETLE